MWKNSSKSARPQSRANQKALLRPIIFHARAAPSVRTLFAPTLADVRILSAMPQLPEAHCRPSTPAEAPTRRRSCRPGNRAWSWKRQDRAVRAIPLAQVSLYATMRRGRSVPHAPCGARALAGHPHPVLAQADPARVRGEAETLGPLPGAGCSRSRASHYGTVRYDRGRHHRVPLTSTGSASTTSTCPLWTRRRCRPALAARKISSAPPRRATFSSTRRWNGVRSETRPRALPPTADEVRVLPTGPQAALIEREEASSADAVGRARAKKGALDRMRRTQFRSCSMVSW